MSHKQGCAVTQLAAPTGGSSVRFTGLHVATDRGQPSALRCHGQRPLEHPCQLLLLQLLRGAQLPARQPATHRASHVNSPHSNGRAWCGGWRPGAALTSPVPVNTSMHEWSTMTRRCMGSPGCMRGRSPPTRRSSCAGRGQQGGAAWGGAAKGGEHMGQLCSRVLPRKQPASKGSQPAGWLCIRSHMHAQQMQLPDLRVASCWLCCASCEEPWQPAGCCSTAEAAHPALPRLLFAGRSPQWAAAPRAWGPPAHLAGSPGQHLLAG